MKVDMVIGLQYGDEGKGKVTNHLIKNNKYEWCCRASGGPNAGHTIYHNGKKIVTHQIPSGIIHGVKSLVGRGCVINPNQLMEEIAYLEDRGIDTKGKIFIDKNVHIITPEHIAEDVKGDKIGSTGRGIMPVYRDKYARIGIRAKNVKELGPFIVDQFEMFADMGDDERVLIEGAQGFWLCPDHGDYPFVTSSPPTSTYALHSLGLPPRSLAEVWGVAKCYETYVGTKRFQPHGEIYSEIQKQGNEFGATTGRMRQVNWINMDDLTEAIFANGVTHLVVNKMDVMDNIMARQKQLMENIMVPAYSWAVRDNSRVENIYTADYFKATVSVCAAVRGVIDVFFSGNPETI